jgi:hypothetical protein
MIGWILLAVAIGLFLFGAVREGFAATSNIKAPPYNDADAMRIFNKMSSADQDAVIATRRQNSPRKNQAELKKEAARHVAGFIERFFVGTYAPAKVPITTEQIDAMFSTPGPGGPAETQALKNVLKSYFVDGVGTSVKSGYADALAAIGQNVGYGGVAAGAAPMAAAPVAAAPVAAVPPSARLPTPGDPCGTLGRPEVRGGATIRVYTKAECDTLGGNYSANGECTKKTGGSFTWDCRNVSDTPAVTPPTPGAGASTPPTTGRTAGGTTGGTSVTSPAPNAGGGGKGKGVFGPTFTSLGAAVGGNTGGDSTRTNAYPELMGGLGDQSVRTSAGIQSPSQNWLLSQSGALPSTASLGSDPNSGYLPYSRVPGDQDLIPDPYRLSRNFSTSSYSSKTDPVPFLTDFSAFSK